MNSSITVGSGDFFGIRLKLENSRAGSSITLSPCEAEHLMKMIGLHLESMQSSVACTGTDEAMALSATLLLSMEAEFTENLR